MNKICCGIVTTGPEGIKDERQSRRARSSHLLRAFMEIDTVDDRSVRWMVIIHLTFVVSGVLPALMDWITERAPITKYTSLNPSAYYGTDTGMGEMRKITVEVPVDDLSAAQSFTGSGVTETVREGLKRLAVIRAQQDMRALRGTFKFSVDLDTLREDRTFEKKRK